MDEIYTKIQVYLIKKDKECENLRFLTSRTTQSNAAHVTDVCSTIKNILEDHGDRVGHRNAANRVQHFKFLLLNTNFKSQEYLCEDLANGHLVDICPPLSPYLFVELIWALGYEDVLSDSILYVPMDLCSEIVGVLRRCLDVDFHRAFDTVLKVVTNCYKKLVSALRHDTQALEGDETLNRFVASVQELVSQLPALQTMKIEGLSQLAKYERCGWALIRHLDATRGCMEARRQQETLVIEDEKLEKFHRLTFGRDFMIRLDPRLVSEAVDQLTKQLVDLLLSNVKKIDCYVYMGWAEINGAEDASTSMQRAVGLACYNFVEFLGDDRGLEEYTHVVECLNQLSSKPDAPSSMNLAELCGEVDKGNVECLRKLIERYEEWDSTAISCLERNSSSIDKAECSSLINGAVKFLEISTQENICATAYAVVMRILLGQKLLDMIEIVVEFILVHDASRKLESAKFEADFKSYVNQGLALCSSKTSLRIILFFAIQNPREVLKTLVKTCIGYSDYSNGVMLPDDLCRIFPILKIRDSNNISLFSKTLKEICGENSAWSSKKFVNLIRVSVDRSLLSADDILNDVFIPVLKNEVTLPNLQTILTSIRTVKDDLTEKMNKTELLYALALQMASLRKNTETSIHSREESMNLLVRIIHHFASGRISSIDVGADSFSHKLEADLEPLDRIYFAPRWGWIRNEICLDQILQDYKRRCFRVINQAKEVKSCEDMKDFLGSHGLETSDFLQHLILRCTEFEYLRLAKEAIIIHWNYLGWKNELEAYARFSLATVKAVSEHLDSLAPIGSWESVAQRFSSLIKGLVKLTIWFISIDVMKDYESVHRSLVAAINALNLSQIVSPDLSRSYQEFKTGLDRTIDTVFTYDKVAESADSIDKFVDRCLLHMANQSAANVDTRSLSVRRSYVNSTFISICLSWPVEENSLLWTKIDKKLYSG